MDVCTRPSLGPKHFLFQLSVSNITAQTWQALNRIDTDLIAAGTDRTKLLEGRIWLKDIKNHYRLYVNR